MPWCDIRQYSYLHRGKLAFDEGVVINRVGGRVCSLGDRPKLLILAVCGDKDARKLANVNVELNPQQSDPSLYHFYSITLEPRVEQHTILRASNTSPPLKRLTFL